jgi:hypothetical protein
MARWQDLMPLHEEYEQQAASDEEGTMGGAPATHHRAKPRRKSHQRPQVSTCAGLGRPQQRQRGLAPPMASNHPIRDTRAPLVSRQ